MPERKFYIDAEKKQRVRVSWDGKWTNFAVFLNDEKLGDILDIATRKDSTKYILADGSQLSFRLNSKGELECRLDGYLIPGSGESKAESLRSEIDELFRGIVKVAVGFIAVAILIACLVIFNGDLNESKNGQYIYLFFAIILPPLPVLFTSLAYWVKASPNSHKMVRVFTIFVLIIFFIISNLFFIIFIYFPLKINKMCAAAKSLTEELQIEKIASDLEKIGK